MNSLYDFHDEYYMRLALDEARAAADEGEIPIGAVVVDSAGNIIGRGHNRTESLCDVTAHAEMQAISAAARMHPLRYCGTVPHVCRSHRLEPAEAYRDRRP